MNIVLACCPAGPRRRGWILLVFALGLAGCSQEGVHYYPRVPKDSEPALAQKPPSEQEAKLIDWTLPAGWVDKGTSRMRAGSFSVEGPNGQSADVSVIPLSSWAGQELNNLNRWRAQVGLQPISAEELPGNTAIIEIAGARGQFFEVAGTDTEEGKRKRILAAVLPRPDFAWSFKMFGDDALVLAQKPAFMGFLKSVRFPSRPEMAGTNLAPQATGSAVAGKPPAASKPSWSVPAGWQEQPPGNLQLARFVAEAQPGGKAEVSVTVLTGEGGGALANVNRWRRQMGLEPVDQAGLAKLTTSLDVDGSPAILVDMISEDRQNRTVACIVPHGGETWFFKLTGSDSAAGSQKQAFTQFVRSAR